MEFPKEGQPSEEREGGGVTAADAPLHRIEIIDAVAYALAVPQRETPMAECDHPAWSFHTNGLTAKVLQCLVVGKRNLWKSLGTGIGFLCIIKDAQEAANKRLHTGELLLGFLLRGGNMRRAGFGKEP